MCPSLVSLHKGFLKNLIKKTLIIPRLRFFWLYVKKKKAILRRCNYVHSAYIGFMRAQKNIPEQLKLSDFADKSLLILDDDDPLRSRLARAMEKKGFQ